MAEMAAEQEQFEQEFQCDDIYVAQMAHEQEVAEQSANSEEAAK